MNRIRFCIARPRLQQLRKLTTGPEFNVYHQRADRYFDHLVEYLEMLGDDLESNDYDVMYSTGVLTLKTDKGTYVMNKQPPNRQIWLSSPISYFFLTTEAQSATTLIPQ
jgi:frataxin-like iron-binding protein CyaY